ncbi:MAG: MBL fold metallo-hydrolase, partial [Candidatus Aminicenantes bacterium]|nr:MBL fold metallo-hydrolase [Candidatus Aminicenantes bacterium]
CYVSGVMAVLHVLGTGGAAPTAERDNTAFALEAGGPIALIDCPGSVLLKLKKAGIDGQRLEALLVTHVHPDHVYGLPSLVHGLMLVEGRLRVFGSQESLNFCGRLLDLFGLREPKIRMRVELVAVEPGSRFRVHDGLEAFGIPVPHTAASLAFHLYFQDSRNGWVFSGDTPPVPQVFLRAGEADGLVHDCSAPERFFVKEPALRSMHTSSDELGRMAAEAGVARLIPCHFFGDADFRIEEIENEIRRHYRGRLLMPRDGQAVPLSAF